MGNYRDDTQETAIAHAAAWGGQGNLTGEAARLADATLTLVRVWHTDAAWAIDEALDKASATVTERARALDAVRDGLQALTLALEMARVGDEALGASRATLQDTARAGDQTFDCVAALLTEWARVSDAVLTGRCAHSMVGELVRVKDAAPMFARGLVLEAAAARDASMGRMRARSWVADAATLTAAVMQSRRSTALAGDGARAHDAAWGRLGATRWVTDLGVADGWAIQPDAPDGVTGQAWTANTQSWAMSRWAPLRFAALAVVDGHLLGLADDGVYELDAPDALNDGAHGANAPEPFEATLVTAPLSVGSKALAHPLEAVLGYALTDGEATMRVTTTQDGQARGYDYALRPDLMGPATRDLATGRFVFGRGLRGRYFSFALRMRARQGYVEDWRVTLAPTQRRV